MSKVKSKWKELLLGIVTAIAGAYFGVPQLMNTDTKAEAKTASREYVDGKLEVIDARFETIQVHQGTIVKSLDKMEKQIEYLYRKAKR